MRGLRIMIAVLVLAILVIVLLLRDGERAAGPFAALPDADAASPEQEPRDAAELATGVEDAERAAVEAPAAEPARAPDAAIASDGLAGIRGRFLLPSGAPARGVALHVHGWSGNQDRLLKHGEPKGWVDPSGESAPDGSFALRFDPPRAYQFTLEAKLPGHAAANWRWHELAPGSSTDLGDVTLAEAGSVLARVVDGEGRPIASGWTVYADGTAQGGGGPERDETRVRAALEGGAALLEGLPPGPAALRAQSPIANWIDGPLVQVRAGEVVEAEIRYTGPDNSRRIVVDTSSRPFSTFGHDVGPITLTGPGIEPRAAQKIQRSAASYAFDDLEPGSYSVQIDDPRFLPWREDGVRPGTSLRARLRGNAAVSLTVVDDATGTSVEPYELDVRFDGVNFRPNVVRVRARRAEPPPGGVYDGLIPRDQTLVVRAEGYSPCEVQVSGLAASETRPLVARLARGIPLAGRVVTSGTDEPPGGAAVRMRRGVRAEWGVIFSESDGLDTLAAQTGPDGRFAFERVGSGRWTIEASISTLVFVERVIELPADAQAELVLELPAAAFLAGRCLAPEGARFDGLTLLAMPTRDAQATWDPRDHRWALEDSFAAAIGDDGSFRTPALPAGMVDVSLRLPMVTIPTGRRSRMGQAGGSSLLESIVLAPGENRRDFDLREVFPGRIAVTVIVNGSPAAGAVVQAHSVESQRSSTGAVVLDADGRGALGPLAPGTYRLSASAVEGGWNHDDPRRFQVAPNQAFEVRIEIALAQGALLVVDSATGAPRANEDVWLMALDGQVSAQSRRTDGDGRLRLELSAGRYRIWQGNMFDGEQRGVVVDWTAAGPSPARVAL